MRTESWVGIVLVTSLLSTVIISAEPRPACGSSFVLPSNIQMPADLRQLFQRIYHRSPTFRGQCEKISAANDVRVEIVLDLSIPRFCRAFTNVRRTPHGMHAEIHVRPGALLVELLAHEFEHVIEQLEGVDMRALAKKRGSGVREVFFEIFESDRAQRVGQTVVREEQIGSTAD